MDQNALIFPMMALIAWTLLTLLLVPFQRFKAAFSGQVTGADFKYGESPNVPPAVSIPNRNYMNLLEGPVLFYALCLITHVTAAVTPVLVWLAWSYVGIRVLQSLVHLTYNHVFHRLALFATSNLIMTAIWVGLLLELTG